MFRVLTPIIRSSYSCNYSFWYWLTGFSTIRSRCWVGTDSTINFVWKDFWVRQEYFVRAENRIAFRRSRQEVEYCYIIEAEEQNVLFTESAEFRAVGKAARCTIDLFSLWHKGGHAEGQTSPRPALRRSYSHYFWELRRCDFGSATDWLNASVSGEMSF